MFNFDFLLKGLGMVSPPHFVYDFSRKTMLRKFLLLCSINCPYFIALNSWDIGEWQSWELFVKIITFEIKLIFPIKSFFYLARNSRQKNKYLENENSFWGEINSTFIIFKGLSVAKNCLKPGSEAFNLKLNSKL